VQKTFDSLICVLTCGVPQNN